MFLFFYFIFSQKIKAKDVILRKYDTIILKAAHGNGVGSVIASMALTSGLFVASIARFIF